MPSIQITPDFTDFTGFEFFHLLLLPDTYFKHDMQNLRNFGDQFCKKTDSCLMYTFEH